jgi:poly [ADP-ribose] polymerase 2/3/4
MANKIHLVQVTAQNNNKFYDLEELGDTFKATWGRIGVTSTSKTYPISQWNSKYNEKIKKGYSDQSRLFVVDSFANSDDPGIKDPQINALVKALRGYASKSINSNYTVDASQVTDLQVKEAQSILDTLSKLSLKSVEPDEANTHLISLYKVIPRRMGKVQDHILKKDLKPKDLKKQLQEIVTAEQNTLDVMAGQVQTITQTTNTSSTDLLDLSGLQLVEFSTNSSEWKLVERMMGTNKGQLEKVYGVIFNKTEKAFVDNLSQAKDKTTQLYWHGSRNENWWSILQSGLMLRPTNAIITGKLYGTGIYYADSFLKSYGYTSGNNSYWAGGTQNVAYMGIFLVHLGNSLHVKHYESWCSSLTYTSLRDKGEYDSVFAERGGNLRNNEYIIYKECQNTIRYLVKVSAK